MRKLKYLLCTMVNVGSEDSPVWEEHLAGVEMEYTEQNLAVAQEEAYQGDYEIYDDGQPEPDNSTTDDVLNVLLGVSV